MTIENRMKSLVDKDGIHDGVTVEEAYWSPGLALLTAGVWGFVATAGLVAVTGTVAWYVPLMTTHLLLRVFLTFVVAAVLFAVVQRQAGMVGWACTLMALTLTALVLLSHHVVYAIHGVPTSRDEFAIEGWQWLSMTVLAQISGLPFLIGGGIGAVLWHRDGVNFHVLSDVFSLNVRGS